MNVVSVCKNTVEGSTGGVRLAWLYKLSSGCQCW